MEAIKKPLHGVPTAQPSRAQAGRDYLTRRCDEHLLDFHHAAEYLSTASAAFSAEGTAESASAKAWAQQQRATLRDEPAGAMQVLASMRRRHDSRMKRSCQP